MKQFFISIFCLFIVSYVIAQNDFIGIAKYKMTLEGSKKPVTDSMSVIFSRQKIKVILYMPNSKDPGHVSERFFIDDFITKKSITVNTETKTYKIDTLKTAAKYDFINTSKITAGNNNLLCFKYVVDPNKLDRSAISSADCLASIDFRNSFFNNYYFLGVQPIIIDNRIVMDFVITQVDGVKSKFFITDIKKLENTDDYFNLGGYKQGQ